MMALDPSVDIAKAKRLIGAAAAKLVESGMMVGLGTGSTSSEMVHALGARMKEEGLRLQVCCTSLATEELAHHYNIPVLPLTADTRLDLYLDGADQIDLRGSLVKGHGGALLREKLVATASRRRIIMVDRSKPTARLGLKVTLPVEIVRFGEATTRKRIQALGCSATLRMRGAVPLQTDEGNFVCECSFDEGIANPEALHAALKQLLGVVETGLFIGMCDAVVLGTRDGAQLYELAEWKKRCAELLVSN